MAEIRLDVELAGTPERAWQTLTDPGLLDRWSVPGGWAVARGAVFQLGPAPDRGLPDPVDVEVLDVVAGQRLVMQWTGPTLHTEMTWSLLPGPAGCRLSVVQSGFFGTPQSVRARELRAAYWEMFGRRLPGLLSGQAPGDQVPAGAGAGGRPTSRPVPRRMSVGGEAPSLWAAAAGAVARVRRLGRRAYAPGSVVAVFAVAAVAALWVFLHPYGAPTLRPAPVPGSSSGPVAVGGLPPTLVQAGQNGAGVPPGGAPSAAASTAGQGHSPANLGGTPGNGAATSPGVSGGGGPAAVPGNNAGRVTGAYQTTKVNGKGNYLGEIALTASGGTVSGWTVVITLPAGAGVNNVTGAAVAQNGTTVMFTPDGDAQITPGGPAVVIDFKVLRPSGTTAPLSCTVNDQPCS